MVLETEPLSFVDWLDATAPIWLQGMAVFAALWIAFACFRLLMLYGWSRGRWKVFDGLASVLGDLVRISPRRVFALARLTVKESMRLAVPTGFGVFLAIMMFALWFLDTSSLDPARLYTVFMLYLVLFLVVVMTWLLSVFSLPGDIKHRTIDTIVTKPVRASELVLGRMLGFIAIGTLMLVLMGGASYLFVVRSLDHTHEFLAEEVASQAEDVGSSSGSRAIGTTSTVRNHRHRVLLAPDGSLATDVAQGHWHPVTVEQHAGQDRYVVGPPRGQFHSRVPHYGKLHFKDRFGRDRNREGEEYREGVNVGNEWTYRSYVHGGTLAAAVWRFTDLTRERFPEGMRMDMTIRVFRTHKGRLDRGVLGSYVLRNPRTGLSTQPQDFVAKEYSIDRHLIPARLLDSAGNSIDLFGDLITDGALEIELSCLERDQFFGMAQPDLYLLEREGSVPANFFKGLASIWLQMVLVAALGVMWSTLVNGPVAMVATLGTIVVGFFQSFLRDLAAGRLAGGGTFESLVRMAQHKNVIVELERGWTTTLVKNLDVGVRYIMKLITHVVPDFRALSDVDYVASGYDIPASLLLEQAATAAGYLLPVFLAGYLFFKLREVAR